MNNENEPPARIQQQECRGAKQAIKFAWPNSLVADENTPDVMLWFIKAYDYNQKRVLNV